MELLSYKPVHQVVKKPLTKLREKEFVYQDNIRYSYRFFVFESSIIGM